MEEQGMVQSQAHIFNLMFGFADTMALRCAVELGIPDIIEANHGPATLGQIAEGIKSPSPDMNYLHRIMRFLVHKRVFTGEVKEGGESLYGLTQSAKWLLRDAEFSLEPMVKIQTHPWLMSPWHNLSKCVEEGGFAFEKTHGCEVWDFASQQPEFNEMFNSAMGCSTKITIEALLSTYKSGFEGVQSIVDVGGGTGTLITEIVKAHPGVRGINFDLPHVVATAPERAGVQHTGGDMFLDIPPADAIILKWILHDWSDEDCVKILRNCHKAINNKQGKLIIIETVLQPEGKNIFDGTGMIFDLVMIAHSSGGKERTKEEWKHLLNKGGFSSYKIIQIPAIPCIIEAYPT